jgi:hypothetical protein
MFAMCAPVKNFDCSFPHWLIERGEAKSTLIQGRCKKKVPLFARVRVPTLVGLFRWPQK